MARHVVIGSNESNDVVTGLVVMKWGDEVIAVVTGRNDEVIGSNTTSG